jgi:replicative DNA helicase
MAARPSMGKTSLAMNIAENVALGDVGPNTSAVPVAIFSLEMSRESRWSSRMLCSRAVHACPQAVRRLHLERAPRTIAWCTAANDLPQAPRASMWMTPPGSRRWKLRARARRLKRKFDIQLIIVDYLQMMNYPQLRPRGPPARDRGHLRLH